MPSWLASLFVHPEFVLPGMALLSAPVIIHLINRLRFRRVRWAAMEFLLASQQRNRRRILMEQLLLLLLRLIVVAALVCLVARPLINPAQFSLFQETRTHHVALLDDSGSMRDRWGETSGFEAAKEVLRKIAAEGERQPDTQTLTLLLASNPDQPLFTRQNLNAAFSSRLETLLSGLACSHRTPDLAAGAGAAHRLLTEQPAGARNFHLISDFRHRDWEDQSALANQFRELTRAQIAVNLVKTVPEAHPNLGLTELTGAVDVAAANVPLRLAATVHNYGDQVAKEVRLTVLVDGRRLPTTELIESLEPDQEVTREFDVVFPTTGAHDVAVSLPADALEQDNQRYLTLDVPDGHPVLIVSGKPAADDPFYLSIALAPAPGLTGFAPQIEPVEYLRRHPLHKFQSILLLNVAELPSDAVQALEQFVAAGGGLAWYLGDQVRSAFYNEALYREGRGLFPAQLGAATELAVDETNPAPDLALTPHAVFRVFEGEGNSYLDLVRINRYFSVPRDWSPPAGVQVIGALRNKAPLILVHRFGQGTVLTSLTSVGDPWNNFPRLAGPFVAMQLEMAKHIARRRELIATRQVGEPIVLSLDAAAYRPEVEVRPPDGRPVPLKLSMTQNESSAPGMTANSKGSDARYAETYRQTDEPGIYSLTLQRQEGAEEQRRLAYNVPQGESPLKLAPTELILRRLGPDVRATIQEPGDFAWVHGEESTRDLHDLVLMAVLVGLLVEQAFALKLSYHPAQPGGGR
ncbi:MAG: BatA domain-containing protein [Planctomycetales bacterium]